MGPNSPAPRAPKSKKPEVMSLEVLRYIEKSRRPRPGLRLPEERSPIVPAPLPPAPSTPESLPPALTDADLDTYIRPLTANGWGIGSARVYGNPDARAALKGHPALRRVYHFTGYAAARDFFNTAVAAMPAPIPGSFVSVILSLYA